MSFLNPVTTSTPQQNLAFLSVNIINHIFQTRNLNIVHDPSLSRIFVASKSLSCFNIVISFLDDSVFVVSFYASPVPLFSTALGLGAQTCSRMAWVLTWAPYT